MRKWHPEEYFLSKISNQIKEVNEGTDQFIIFCGELTQIEQNIRTEEEIFLSSRSILVCSSANK